MSSSSSLQKTRHHRRDRSLTTATNLLSNVESYHRTLVLSLRDEHLNLCALAEEYNTLLSVVAPEQEKVCLATPPCFMSTERPPHRINHLHPSGISDGDPSSSSSHLAETDPSSSAAVASSSAAVLPITATSEKQLLVDDLLMRVLSGAPPSSFPHGYGPESTGEKAALLPPSPPRLTPSTAELVECVLLNFGPPYLQSLESAVPPATQLTAPSIGTRKESNNSTSPVSTTNANITSFNALAATPHQNSLLLLQRMLSVEEDSAVLLDSLTPSAFLALLPLLACWLGKCDISINSTNPHVQRHYNQKMHQQRAAAVTGSNKNNAMSGGSVSNTTSPSSPVLPPSHSDAQFHAFAELVFVNAAFILVHESISMFTSQEKPRDAEPSYSNNNSNLAHHQPPPNSHSFLLDRTARRDWRLIVAGLTNIEENDELMANFKWGSSVGLLRNFIQSAANL